MKKKRFKKVFLRKRKVGEDFFFVDEIDGNVKIEFLVKKDVFLFSIRNVLNEIELKYVLLKFVKVLEIRVVLDDEIVLFIIVEGSFVK